MKEKELYIESRIGIVVIQLKKFLREQKRSRRVKNSVLHSSDTDSEFS